MAQVRHHELRPIPRMPNSAGIGRRINARAPVWLARPAAGRDVLMLPARQGRRLLNPDDVVLQPQVSIDVLLRLEMPRDDPRAIPESKHAAVSRELMSQAGEEPPPKVLEVFHVRLADFTQ